MAKGFVFAYDGYDLEMVLSQYEQGDNR